MDNDHQITELLAAWDGKDRSTLDRLMPLVEGELRKIARRHMRRENAGHTLQTTALVNEAYLKVAGQSRGDWQNRQHFFAIVAKIMRRILLNHARDKKAGKRGGSAAHLHIDDVDLMCSEKSEELIALDESLERLANLDKLKSQIVELRYFAGLSLEETAKILDVSVSNVSLHWRMARAWLKNDIQRTL